ncbi:MAG: hypothetical protein HYV08_18505 [Deltaproteobacteria bacterium]|nr:hypothetical protein [Deltaproteobacteria bacterium]
MAETAEILEILVDLLGDAVEEERLRLAAERIAELGLLPSEEWEELKGIEDEMGYKFSVLPPEICKVEGLLKQGAVLKIFRKKAA